MHDAVARLECGIDGVLVEELDGDEKREGRKSEKKEVRVTSDERTPGHRCGPGDNLHVTSSFELEEGVKVQRHVYREGKHNK